MPSFHSLPERRSVCLSADRGTCGGRWIAAAAIYVAVLVLPSCSEIRPVILYNESQEPVEVEYEGVRAGSDCSLVGPGPQLVFERPEEFKYQPSKVSRPAKYIFDRDACIARATIPSQSTLLIHVRSECVALTFASAAPPEFKRFRVSGMHGTVERAGWDASKLFQPGPSHTCLFTYR